MADFDAGKSAIFDAAIDGLSLHMLQDQTFTQVTLTESLLSPSLMTQIHIQDVIMSPILKIYDEYKGKNFILSATNPNIPGIQIDVNNVIYRIQERKPFDRNFEFYKLVATDKSLLLNQTKRISKQYYKQNPSAIVSDALNVLGITSKNIEQTTPIRDYVARNVHPFEVVYDQANYALAKDNDPSLLHYMTYENNGTHHFRSIKQLTKQNVKSRFVYEDKGSGNILMKPYVILTYEFPCEFDLLSDLMNGVGKNGSTAIAVNTVKSMFNSFGSLGNAVLGNQLSTSTFSNKGSTDHSSETNFEASQQLRPARLALLNSDRISLRMSVPFNPQLHAGDMIYAHFPTNQVGVEFEFGTGDYMIVSLTHNLRIGGYGITTLDCVARTVGSGIV